MRALDTFLLIWRSFLKMFTRDSCTWGEETKGLWWILKGHKAKFSLHAGLVPRPQGLDDRLQCHCSNHTTPKRGEKPAPHVCL